MISSINLIRLDIYADYIPVVSTITNLFNIFQIIFIRNENINNDYFTYITNKKFSRIATASMPVIGNIAILFMDYIEKRDILNGFLQENITPFINSNVSFKYDKRICFAALTVNSLAFQYIPKPLQANFALRYMYYPRPSGLIFPGDQNNCDGKVLVVKAQSIVDNLLKIREDGVFFNKNKVSEIITGGTCTAQALKFAKSYIKLIKKIKIPGCKINSLYTTLFCIQKLESKVGSSNIKMRTKQAAFNTIELVTPKSTVDYSKNKIQSIVRYYGFTIDHISSEFNMKTITTSSNLANFINPLPLGIFVIRGICPSNNEKLEIHGHSMIYINNSLFKIFYDPSSGAKILPKENFLEDFFQVFKEYLEAWTITIIRFYRLNAA